MSCGWLENFAVNNEKLKIMYGPCQSNFPVYKSVAAHKTFEFVVPIMFLTELRKGNYPYQISMELNYDPLNGAIDNDGVKYSRREPAKLIWSNKSVIIIK